MYERHREEMVRKFVVEAGIDDPKIIAAMLKIPRHLFVETGLRHQAYMGKSLPIGFGQTISHPTTVAMMTHLMQLNGNERVLEIGTGSGYQAAVLAEIGVKVFTIERIAALANRAQKLFDQLGYYSIAVRIGDGSVGWVNHAPYDRIIATAGSPGVPQNLVKQLSIGGKLIIPVGNKQQQRLVIAERTTDGYKATEVDSRNFVPLIGKNGWTN
jgi:protein-L-isoaspartate(D-aspartate) O-methyltransferase